MKWLNIINKYSKLIIFKHSILHALHSPIVEGSAPCSNSGILSPSLHLSSAFSHINGVRERLLREFYEEGSLLLSEVWR